MDLALGFGFVITISSLGWVFAFRGLVGVAFWLILRSARSLGWGGLVFNGRCWGQALTFLTVSLSLFSLLCHTPVNKRKQYIFCVLLICFFSRMAFYVNGGMLFFLLFELTFFPISYIIIIWGHNYERVAAVIYMVLYSVTGSIFHMFGMALANLMVGSVSFRELVFLMGGRDWEIC